MKLDRNRANQIFNRQFGRLEKAKDFAGREIAKAAYGDKNSEYGWNVDHILPKSQGGTDETSNLMVCHIRTNEEKADRYPTFRANGRIFQIVRKNGENVVLPYDAKPAPPKAPSVDARTEALALWEKQFRFQDRAVDFAGREIQKGAYGQENSRYRWTVVPVLPQKYGQPKDFVCCHVCTGQEKGEHFPNFKANGKDFLIMEKNGRHKITVPERVRRQPVEDHSPDFQDVNQGLAVWKRSKQPPKVHYVDFVKICVDVPGKNSEILGQYREFIRQLFHPLPVFEERSLCGWGSVHSSNESCVLFVVNFDASLQKDTQALLEKCVLLNTYAHYFDAVYESQTRIHCRGLDYDASTALSWEAIRKNVLDCSIHSTACMSIDESIKDNAADDTLASGPNQYGIYEYDVVDPRLDCALQRHLDGTT